MKGNVRIFMMFIVFLCCYHWLHGQHTSALKKQIEDKSGSEKVNLLIKLCNDCSDDELESNTRNLLDYSYKKNIPIGISAGYYYLGLNFENNNQNDSALHYFNRSLNLRKQLHQNKSQVAEVINSITSLYILNGDYKNADSSINECLKFVDDTLSNLAAEVHNQRGYMEGAQGNFHRSIYHYNKALAIWKHNKSMRDVSICLNNLANSYGELNNIEQSISAYKESLSISSVQGFQSEMANSINGLSLSFLNMDDYVNALKYVDSSIQLNRKEHSELNLATNYNNKGGIYEAAGDFNSAVLFYKKCLDIRTRLIDKGGMPIIQNNIGMCYIRMNIIDSARKYFDLSYQSAIAINEQRTKGLVLNNLAAMFFKLRKLDSALIYFEQCVEVFKQIDNKKGIASVFNSKSEIYLELHDLRAAEMYGLKGMQVSKDLGYPKLILKAASNLARIYSRKKQFEDAYNMQLLVNGLSDSIRNDEVKTTLIKSKFQYEFEAKEARLQLENQRNQIESTAAIQKQRNLNYSLIGGGLGLSIISFLSFVNYRNKRKKEGAELRSHAIETDLKALRSQMNPHFIFNSLQSIQAYLYRNESKVASTYLTKFSKLMRMVLENSERDQVFIENEIEALSLYMDLEGLRFSPPFSYKFSISDKVNPEGDLIPPLILQPFIENSIKHGFRNDRPNQLIKILIDKDDKELFCVIEDNGVGRGVANSSTVKSKQISLGMKLTVDRLRIIYANSGNLKMNDDSYFKISDLYDEQNLPKGTKVELKIPMYD